MITRKMLERLVVQAAKEEKVEDLHPQEVEFYLNSMIAAIAVRTVNLVLDGKDSCLALRAPLGSLDFEELPRNELLEFLEHSSGLPAKVCARGLDKIDSMISLHLQGHDRVMIEHLGEMVLDNDGYHLVLEERLQVRRLQKS